MKKLILAGLLICMPMLAQGPPPSLVGLMSSSDGVNWSVVTTTSTAGAFPPTFTPSKVGILCFNNSTSQWTPCTIGGGGGDTITSPNSTLNVGGTSTNTTLDLNLAKANTWTNGMTIQAGLTVDTIAISADGAGISFPQGSTILENATNGLFIQDDNSGGIISHGGILDLLVGSMTLSGTDGTNTFGSLLKVQVPIGAAAAGLELLNGNTAALMRGTSGSLLNSGNTIENQLGVVAAATFVPGVFAPQFAIGDNTIVMKGATAYTPVVNTTAGATPVISASAAQSFTLSANATPTVTPIFSGEHVAIQVCQPASGGPFTWTWPAAIVGGQPPPTGASTCSQQAFDSYNGTTLVAEGNQYASLTNTGTQNFSGNVTIPVGSSLNTPILRSQDGTAAATLSVGRWTFPASGALSTPTMIFTGSPIGTGGSGTTTWPMFLMQPTGTTTTTWSTAGTYFGINAASSFTGNFFDFQFNGTSRLSLTGGGTLFMQTLNAVLMHTFTNCLSAASPAVCAAAPSGSVAVAAGTNPTLQVNTTAVTANSQILLTEDEGLSTRLSVTCQSAVLPSSTVITARSAGASFTFQVNGTFTTNPICYSYTILN